MIPLPSNYKDFDLHFSTSSDKIVYPVETTPKRYLEFAIEDLEHGTLPKTSRILVNALSNAKRALHLQVETIAKAFGFKNDKKGFPNFHVYLAFCQRCGIVTPRILKKLNSVRNAVEHEYYLPGESETEDFIDVVELFLSATDRFIYQFPTSMEWLPGTTDDIVDFEISSVELEPNTGSLLLITSPTKPDESLELDPSYEEFFIWLKVLCCGVHEGHLESRS